MSEFTPSQILFLCKCCCFSNIVVAIAASLDFDVVKIKFMISLAQDLSKICH